MRNIFTDSIGFHRCCHLIMCRLFLYKIYTQYNKSEWAHKSCQLIPVCSTFGKDERNWLLLLRQQVLSTTPVFSSSSSFFFSSPPHSELFQFRCRWIEKHETFWSSKNGIFYSKLSLALTFLLKKNSIH